MGGAYAVLSRVEDDCRLHVQRVLELQFQPVPEGGEAARGDHRVEVRAGRLQQAVVAVELAIGEPEAVVGARVEPAGIVGLSLLAQNVGSGAEVAGDAIDEARREVAVREALGPSS